MTDMQHWLWGGWDFLVLVWMHMRHALEFCGILHGQALAGWDCMSCGFGLLGILCVFLASSLGLDLRPVRFNLGWALRNSGLA